MLEAAINSWKPKDLFKMAACKGMARQRYPVTEPRPGQETPTSTRAGMYVRQPGGFDAFVPSDFPPRDLELTPRLVGLLSRADHELGKLVGTAQILPDPDLFVLMYVRREAVLSSQIEGTQASLADFLAYEALHHHGERPVDVHEISNYINALRYGFERVETLPVSLRLIREIHAQLMHGVRGGEPARTPGEFRRSQNWVGGGSPATARYVPPPVVAMQGALDQFERFLHAPNDLPLLIKIGLVHAQFETIHPFLDGNGRIGRLLVTFILCHQGVLSEPLLYLSIFFKENRAEYYDRLQAVRDRGDWEGWLAFFLRGVAQVARQATETAQRIVNMRERLRNLISQKLRRGAPNALRLLDYMFQSPYLTVKLVQRDLGLSQPGANALVGRMETLGILRETTGRRRNRVYAFSEYLSLFEERDQRQ